MAWFMVFNATFNNMEVISWRSVLLMEKNGVPGEWKDIVTIHIHVYKYISLQFWYTRYNDYCLTEGATYLIHIKNLYKNEVEMAHLGKWLGRDEAFSLLQCTIYLNK
jgi:hypothetical protein